ncbi:hypothetical protein DFQ27_007653 [Actinomortierella ambigua]|uniref:Uncharacterized protein n=1 Tax=Actinomortierella ambigua TaxID=1343610 RepID=A0A9P6TZE6_9FUNG|nr:hypothetical protein DFQ27_007653 [Actinomortierella ambigua]
MDTLSHDRTSLSSPEGDEWELIENGPRKSIDQLWDEVYDYRRKLQQEQLALAQSLPVHASAPTSSFLNMTSAGSNHHDPSHLLTDDYYYEDDGYTLAFRNHSNSMATASSSLSRTRPFQRQAPRRRNTLSGGTASSGMSHSYSPSSSTAFSHHRYHSWSEYDDSVDQRGLRRNGHSDFYDLPVVEECRDDEEEDEDEEDSHENDDEYNEDEYHTHAHAHAHVSLDLDDEDALSGGGPSGSAMAGLLLDDTMVSLGDYYSSLATSLTSLTSELDEQQKQQEQLQKQQHQQKDLQKSSDSRSRSSSTSSSAGGFGPSSKKLATLALPPPPSSTSSSSTIEPSSACGLPFLPKANAKAAQLPPPITLPPPPPATSTAAVSPLSPCTMSSSSSSSTSSSPLSPCPLASSDYAIYSALSSPLSPLPCTCNGSSSSSSFGTSLARLPFSSTPSPTSLLPNTDHNPSCALHWQQSARLDPTTVFASKNRTRVEPGAAMGLLRSYLLAFTTGDSHSQSQGRKNHRVVSGMKAATYGYHKHPQHAKPTKRLSLPFF